MVLAIRGKLIPALLYLPPEEVKDELRTLLSHDVKQGGLNFRTPATGAACLNQASVEASAFLVESLLGNGELNFVGHKDTVREAFAAARKENVDGKLEAVKVMLTAASKVVTKRLGKIGKAGEWLPVMYNLLNNTCLSMEEWQYNTRIRYGYQPLGLCEHCSGCGAGFTVQHGLS